jgi:peptidoglycan-associated lipoprotein
VAPVVVVAHEDPANALANERSVFFDYDDFNVKAEFAAMVERHGRYLATHPAVNVRVEGHTDERGSTEYNLALGQKRAQSVVAALRRHGARDVQMEALSWGKERPRNTASNEAAWAENRRVDIVYPGNGSKPGR